jgi:16S rRNA (uracil1498-N3)-methyltransferase
MHLFYQPDLTSEIIQLSEEESKHAVRVLRMSVGEQVEIVDGKGTRALAEVANDHPKRCELRILSRKNEKANRDYYLHIAVAPTKNLERIEWFIEKAVEIGIDEITFLECEHSERDVIKTDRILKVAVSAMKQSQQSWLPVINEMISFTPFVKTAAAEVKLIAHCEDDEKNPIASLSFSGKKVLVLIGPEGDFSRAEIEAALQHQFTPVSLGETRLRTETAALYAVTAISILQ